jgi:hypothetical protein
VKQPVCRSVNMLDSTGSRDRRCLLLDPLHNRPHRLMRDAKVSCHRSQPLSPRPKSDVGPTLLWNPRSFRYCGVPPDTQTLPRPQELLWIEEWDQRRLHHVYLA